MRLSQMFNWFRRKYCPIRIYRFGKVGLSVWDDRTKFEKVCDWIGDRLWELERKKYVSRETYVFRPYFDWSLGLMITSPYARREIEKKLGKETITVSDWEKEQAKRMKLREDLHTKKIEEGVKRVLQDVKQGRSFQRESLDRRAEIFKQHGVKH
jgi:hypothetical protein